MPPKNRTIASRGANFNRNSQSSIGTSESFSANPASAQTPRPRTSTRASARTSRNDASTNEQVLQGNQHTFAFELVAHPIDQNWHYGPLTQMTREHARQAYDELEDSLVFNEDFVRRTFSLARFGIVYQSYLAEYGVSWFQQNQVPTFPLNLKITEEECNQWLEEIPWSRLQSVRRLHLSDDEGNRPNLTTFTRSIINLIDNAEEDDYENDEDVDDRIYRASQLFQILTQFQPSTCCKPEEQYRSKLWMPLLNHFFADPDLSVMPEYYVRQLGVSGAPNFSLDLVVNLRRYPKYPPIFLTEVSAHRLDDNQVHKDFQKLACAMWLSALFYCGKLASSPECRGKIRIGGALIAGTQIQYCVMIPIFREQNSRSRSSNSSSAPYIDFLFQTSREWRYDLSSPSFQTCSSAECRDCCSDCEESVLRMNVLNSAGQAILRNFTSQNTGTEESNELNDETGTTANNTEETWPDNVASNSYHGRTFGMGMVSAVRSLERITCCVIEFVHDLLICLERAKLKASKSKNSKNVSTKFTVNAKIIQKIPSGRSSHDASTPAQNRSTPAGTKPGLLVPKNGRKVPLSDFEKIQESLGLEAIEDLTRDADGYLVFRCRQIQSDETGQKRQQPICLKLCNYIDTEIQILSKLKEQAPEHIALLKMFTHESQEYGVMLEHLLSYPFGSGEFWLGDPMQFLPRTFEYVLDGLCVLKELKKLGIVHCDIHHGKFLYSAQEHRWKLFGFEHAQFVDSDTKEYVYPTAVGLGYFQAPELKEQIKLQQPLSYSHSTDLFAFACAAREVAVDISVDCVPVFFSTGTAVCNLPIRLQNQMKRCQSRAVDDRYDVDQAFNAVLDLLPRLEFVFANMDQRNLYKLQNYQHHLIKTKLSHFDDMTIPVFYTAI